MARRILRLVPLVALLASTAILGAADAANGATVTLNGDWAAFTRCPVDDPAMLAVDGSATVSWCVAADSPGGSIKLGNTTSSTGETNVQFGLIRSGQSFALVSPPGGAIVAAPVNVPGGVLGLMCPSSDPLVASVCSLATDNALNRVSAVVQAAGSPSDFRFDAVITGAPILTLPIKVQLQNPLLGSNCYIGSDADPIILHPAVTSFAGVRTRGENFDANGTPNPAGPLVLGEISGLTEGDSTFAVPAASGCGLAGALDGAINSRSGLPSPSGNNHVTLNSASSSLASFANAPALFPNAGKQFAADWHSACNGCMTTSTSPGTIVEFKLTLMPQLIFR
ncbi:MAG: hypothetical protein EPO22_13570 [Dehalococcoidia bacterium]|nr:MAG: hypothetical protein EPO22_13570 [Dehalococcoidia bacterium]